MDDRFRFYIGYLGVEIYYPYIIFNNVNLGLKLDTLLIIRISNKWSRHLVVASIALRVLGFGLGISWKHCDNPIFAE